MLRKVLIGLGYGFFWLFVFSIPVGMQRKLFDVAWFYIVDTTPVTWVVNKLGMGVDATSNAAKEAKDNVVKKVDKKLDQADRSLDGAKYE